MSRKDSSGQFLLRVVGGLGQRLNALAASQAVADFDGREFKFCWPIAKSPHPKGRFPLLLPKLYQTQVPQLPEKRFNEVFSKADRRLSLREFNSQLKFGMHGKVVAAHGHGPPEWIRDSGYDPAWRLRVRDAFRKHYTLLPELEEMRRDFAKQHFVPGKMTGLIIRNQGHRLSLAWKPVDRVSRQISECLAEDKERKFFLSCDDNQATRHLQKKFPGKVISQAKPEQINTPEALRMVAVDFELLVQCDDWYGCWASGMTDFVAVLRGEEKRYADNEHPKPRK